MSKSTKLAAAIHQSVDNIANLYNNRHVFALGENELLSLSQRISVTIDEDPATGDEECVEMFLHVWIRGETIWYKISDEWFESYYDLPFLLDSKGLSETHDRYRLGCDYRRYVFDDVIQHDLKDAIFSEIGQRDYQHFYVWPLDMRRVGEAILKISGGRGYGIRWLTNQSRYDIQ